MRWITLALVSLFVCLQSATAQTNMGSVDVGSSSTTSYSVAFLYPGTLAAITGTTGGKQNLDFTANGDSCKLNTYYAANSLCTVNVKFTPTLAGPRYGSVVLTNASGSPLGELFVSGTGMAPQTSFSPAAQTQILGQGSDVFTPNGLATDSGGNAYAVEGTYQPTITGGAPYPGKVLKLPGSINADGTTSTFPKDLSVDGAGNTYVEDFTPGVSYLEPNGSYGWARTPASGITDADGNLYTDCSTGICKEALVFGGTYTLTTISSVTPTLLFVDGAGDVFASTTSGGAVSIDKFQPFGDKYTQTTIASGLNAVTALAADPLGNVYFVDGSSNVLKETLQPNGSYVKTLLFTGAVTQYVVNWADHTQQSDSANRLAVDPAGNVYFWKKTGTFKNTSPNPTLPPTQVPVYGLFEAASSQAGTLTFPQTMQYSISAAQNVTVTNSGNLPLTISAVTFPGDFSSSGPNPEGCAAGTLLTPGESCSIGVIFWPRSFSGTGTSAALTESLNITTNTGNHAGTQQSVTLTGVELAAIAPTPTISFSPLNATSAMVSITGVRYETFYYTTNGSTPTTASARYNGPFPQAPGTTIKAIGAESSAYRNSPVVTAIVPQPTTAAPVFSLNGGTFNYDQNETITSATAGAKIYYTLDGSTPTTASTLFNGSLIVDAITALKAIAIAPGYQASAVSTATFNFVVTQPTITLGNLVASKTGSDRSVTITAPPSEGVYYYTTDGTTPTTSSTRYSAPFNAYVGETVRVIGARHGYTSSTVVLATVTDNGITATPTFNPAGGNLQSGQQVIISDQTPGAQITYTFYPTDGSAAVNGSGAAPLAVTLTTTGRIMAVAFATNFEPSSAANATFFVSAPQAVFSTRK